jgi:hypothetical protein
MHPRYIMPIILLGLAACQVPIPNIPSFFKETTCGPVSWRHGGGDEESNKKITLELKVIGLDAKVTSTSYGEGSSCGGYGIRFISYYIVINNPRDTSQIYLEQTSKEIVDIMLITDNKEIEYFTITYIFPDKEISCGWNMNQVYPEKTHMPHTCIFSK